MKSNLFLPKQINVGYQEREDTYTGQLGYVIYFDEKGKLRKEKSWNGWRDQEIENTIFDNEPIEGFVLNKKAGGYSTGWNHRQTYVRVYDPRGFEFEISVTNLLYILENTNSIKGKGLEGEFVYGYEGGDLVLMPTSSPDFKVLEKLNNKIHAKNFIKPKELKEGHLYLTKQNEELIYMGRMETYGLYGGFGGKEEYSEPEGEKFVFYTRESNYAPFVKMKTVNGKFIDCLTEDPVEDYPYIVTKLECNSIYSPINLSLTKVIKRNWEEFEEACNSRLDYVRVLGKDNREYLVQGIRDGNISYKATKDENGNALFFSEQPITRVKTLIEVYEKLQPMKKQLFLENGNLLKEQTYK